MPMNIAQVVKALMDTKTLSLETEVKIVVAEGEDAVSISNIEVTEDEVIISVE